MIESKLARKPNLAPLGPALRDAASALSGSGLRGNGNDGGWGNADTKGGVGKQKGPGTPKSDRVKRMERWELVFTTNSAAHYLQQLDALGAVVAVPDRRGRLMTIRNWRERPVQLELLDVTGMNRIWWVDDRRETTESVAEELGLDIVPSALVAFFLRPFEDQLAAAERAFAGRAENQIALTRFAITFRNGKHVIRVIEQKGK